MPRIINGPHKGARTRERGGELFRSIHGRPLIAIYRRRQDMDYEYVETVDEEVLLKLWRKKIAQ